MRLVLSGTMNQTQMASSLGYTPENVRLVINSPLFQDELARRRATLEKVEDHAIRDGITLAKDLLSQTAVAAVETMEKVMLTSRDQKVQLDAADKILKYAFPKDTNTGGPQAIVVALSDKKMEQLRSILSECGITSSDNPPPPKMVDSTVLPDGGSDDFKLTGLPGLA
jgi:hypothetical protein